MNTLSFNRQRSVLLAGLSVLLATIAIYWPGLYGGYRVDDFSNIVFNNHLYLDSLNLADLYAAMLSGHGGPLRRPISMLSFALNIYMTGLDPFYMKLVNLGIHVVNGILIFVLSGMLLKSLIEHARIDMKQESIGWAALVAAALWLLHPINLTSVLYVVQRMNALAVTFILLGLISYVYGRRLMTLKGTGFGWLLIGLLMGAIGILAKENAALLPLLMLVIEYVVFRFAVNGSRQQYLMISFYLVTLVVPLILLIGVLILNPDSLLGGYQYRDFSLIERLMTEARAIWMYIGMILLPNISAFSMHYDDFALSTSLVQPLPTLPAVVGIAGIFLFAICIFRKLPVVSLGVLFFLAGHAMESTILPLVLVFEHRNYLPMFGIMFMLSYYILSLSTVTTKKMAVVVSVIAVIVCGFNTALRAQQWSDTTELSLIEAEHNPGSAISQYEAGVALANLLRWTEQKQNRSRIASRASDYFHKAVDIKPTMTEAYTAIMKLHSEYGVKLNEEIPKKLTHLLAEENINSTVVQGMVRLLDCQMSGECSFEQHVISDFMRSTLSNKAISSKHASILFGKYSQYAWKEWNNETIARKFIKESVERNPDNVIVRLNYINFLLASGDVKAAEQQINKAEKLDTWDIRRKELNQLRTQLNNMSQSER